MKWNPQQVVQYSTLAVGNRWVGTAIGIEGDKAIVTYERNTEEEARRATEDWERYAQEAYSQDPNRRHYWEPDPDHPGYYQVVWRGSDGPQSTKK